MDKRKISNITSYFQFAKSTANVSADSEEILEEDIVVNKFPTEIRVPDILFHPNDSYVFPKKGCLESKIYFVISTSWI